MAFPDIGITLLPLMLDLRTRPTHLDVLLARLTAHADSVRHHIPDKHHNLTLGLAAEAGLRDVLRQVLPRRFAVASGFVRSPGGTLILPTGRTALSRQTDVIVYDTAHASPLYGVEGVEVVAAEDVLAVFEVKDSGDAEKDLPDALEHLTQLAMVLPDALRGIVLVRGKDPAKARERIATACLSASTAPHLIYGRALAGGSSYLAFHDRLPNKIHVWNYGLDSISPLTGFLRIVTSFFAAQGLCSRAPVFDLRPEWPADPVIAPVQLDRQDAIPSLVKLLEERSKVETTAAGTEGVGDEGNERWRLTAPKRFFGGGVKSFLEEQEDLRIVCPTVLGLDDMGLPIAGPAVFVRAKTIPSPGAGAFFLMHEQQGLRCMGRGKWRIKGETVEAYLKRTCCLDAEVFLEKFPDDASSAAHDEVDGHSHEIRQNRRKKNQKGRNDVH